VSEASGFSRVVAQLDQHQVAVYLLGLTAGAAVGLSASGAAPALEHAIEPVLAALLYATFLQVPFTALSRAFRDGRFLATVLALNFVGVPVIVFALTRVLPGGDAVLLGVLLVLLTPCIDYVIVFSGLAGGASDRLLAASPLLMLAQLALLPLYLLIFVGRDLADIIEPGPFVRAFVVLIAIPLTLALLTEVLGKRHRVGGQITNLMTSLMVLLLAATLFLVAASQIPEVRDSLGTVALVIPVYVAFAVVMAGLGVAAARLFRLNAPAGRALLFSGVTRNSLVVLPLALALPEQYRIAAAVIVTQTLVELLFMLVYVRLVPRLLPPQPA
jgi:ACR3 family arsenite efflux pump ArsB